MVHKFKNRVESFLFSEMPVDSMDYERKGGFFVTTFIAVIITILFLLLGFIFGLLVYYTTKHAYQIEPPITLEEFIKNYDDENGYASQDFQQITPKHYRLIINPILNDSRTFSGNVWITLTPDKNGIKTIELDVNKLDIRADDISVYRSRILSDRSFQANKNRRSAQLSEEVERENTVAHSTEQIDDNDATDEPQDDSQTNSTEGIGLGIEKESHEAIEDIVDSNGIEITETSSDQSVTEYVGDNNETTTWNGLFKNDSLILDDPDEQVELDIDDVQFDTERKKIIIALKTELRTGDYYIVKVFFTGNMSDDYGLVYESIDDDDTDSSDNFIAATVTDTHHTSAVFPCFNDFQGEVTFQLNLIRHTDYQSVSVSKLKRSEQITNEWTLDVYPQTSPMKLNSFGFIVTNIEAAIVTATPNLQIHSYFRSKLLPSITFIDSEIPSILKFFELYTNVSHPMESITFIGLPDSKNDVMEIKHGLVIARFVVCSLFSEEATYEVYTFSESFFIAYDDADKQRKSSIVFHMIAQLWTQPWQIVEAEDEEWINEALPLQLLLTSVPNTNIYFNTENILEKRIESISKEEDIIDFNLKKFSTARMDRNWIDVAQSKGLYVLAILEKLLSPSVYQMGIQRFYNSYGEADFIETLANMTKDNIELLKTSLDEWTQQIGYPVVHIKKNEKNIQIKETEFGMESSHFWSMPINIKNQTLWLHEGSTNFDIEENNWLTIASNGYFRVNYDDDQWLAILQALQVDHQALSSNDRAILMDDALNLAKNNYLNYSIVERLLERWNERETEYLPWKSAFHNLEFVYRNSIGFPINNRFNILMTNVTQRTYQNIVRSPLGGFSHKLKILIKKWACQIFALPDCVADALKDFQNLIVNDTLKRSQRSSTDIEQLYCTAIRFGDRRNWYLVLSSLDENDKQNFNDALIYSLGCSTDRRILGQYFQLLLNKNYRNFADATLRSMRENQIGKKYALEFLYKNFKQLQDIHGLQTLKSLLKGISSEYDYQLLQVFFTSHASLFKSTDKRTWAEIVMSIENTLEWKNSFTEMFDAP
ncbi:Aminopeptidase Ey [Pseudolycoriella hygida]|uniref:Aminopeptidase Ey n=1 Tax=Pseudolycoriella hygida TaxID=35572 RepID=A0A9Q0MZD0_9DIPT|nr:Aminopeptidase Ey [Pseudolycoriella hygida]